MNRTTWLGEAKESFWQTHVLHQTFFKTLLIVLNSHFPGHLWQECHFPSILDKYFFRWFVDILFLVLMYIEIKIMTSRTRWEYTDICPFEYPYELGWNISCKTKTQASSCNTESDWFRPSNVVSRYVGKKIS
jgi:hypothetical protein